MATRLPIFTAAIAGSEGARTVRVDADGRSLVATLDERNRVISIVETSTPLATALVSTLTGKRTPKAESSAKSAAKKAAKKAASPAREPADPQSPNPMTAVVKVADGIVRVEFTRTVAGAAKRPRMSVRKLGLAAGFKHDDSETLACDYALYAPVSPETTAVAQQLVARAAQGC